MAVTILHGDCREVMAGMEPNSVDAIVTDPPYGLEFMGKDWDAPWKRGEGVGEHNAEFSSVGYTDGAIRLARPSFVGGTNPTCRNCGGTRAGNDRQSRKRCRCDAPDFPNTTLPRMLAFQAWTESWAVEAFRVLKPGGRLLAFGGTRTHHRMVCAIEDAGFVIEDTIAWLYGSGFPKHKSKLKPAHEPICVAWKPDAKATPLNIDACRIGTTPEDMRAMERANTPGSGRFRDTGRRIYDLAPTGTPYDATLGRWPANVCLSHMPPDENGEGGCVPVGTKRVKGNVCSGTTRKVTNGYGGAWGDLDLNGKHYADADGTETVAAWDCHPDCAVALLDAQSGERPSGAWNGNRNTPKTTGIYGTFESYQERGKPADSGGASRFFYTAKASRRERNAGLAGLPEHEGGAYANGAGMPGRTMIDGEWVQTGTWQEPNRTARANHHPTVKPIALMAWLIRLVAKPGDTVLDPFMGSGSTGCAAALEGVGFIGIEQNAEYIEIAERRIAHWTEHGADGLKPKATVRKTIETHTDLPLFAPLSLVAD
jgi:DNA modification methylase